MKIIAFSDNHGYLPKLEPCDVVCICGDIIPLEIQRDIFMSWWWFNNKFKEWAEKLEKKGLSVKFMNKIHNVLNNIFAFAIKFYGLESNPSKAFGSFEEKNDKVNTCFYLIF